MAFDIYVLFLLLLCGLVCGTIALLVGLKRPLKLKRIGSYCTYCNEQYEWYQLIPVLSYYINKGECPYCHKKTSFWFPLLELFSGFMFSVSYVLYGLSYELIAMIILILLTVIVFASDFKHYIILDGPLIVFSILILLFKFLFYDWKVLLLSFCSGCIIFIFMLGIRFLGNKAFKQEALGGGDIKLATLFGFVLGLRLSIVSIILGSFLAFPCAIYYSLKGKNKEIPFGPFLVLGLDITFLFMDKINWFLAVIFK